MFNNALFRSLLAVSLAIGALALNRPAFAAITLGPDGEEILNDNESKDARLLGAEYKDEADGFSIRPPANSRLIQRAGLEYLSFVLDAKQWGGTVELYVPADREKKTLTVEEYLKGAALELTKNPNFKGLQILESREIMFAGKPAGKLAVSMESAGKSASMAVYKQQLAVQTGTNAFLVLTFFSPLTGKDEAAKTFDMMTKSLQVFDRKDIETRRGKAIDAGRAFLTGLSAEDLTRHLSDKPQLFRIKIDNRDVGYVRFDEKEDTYLGYKGVMVVVSSRTFPEDGSIVMGMNTAFWAYKKQDPRLPDANFSCWQNNAKTVVFGARGQENFWTTELGTLQFGVPEGSDQKAKPAYIVAVDRHADEHHPLNDPAMKTGLAWAITDKMPPPLPKVVEYVWPRLVDLSKPTQIAFSVFNSPQSRMGLSTLTVNGAETITLDGRSYKTTKLTVAIDPGYTDLWVDETGKTIMMRTSDMSTLVPTSEERMTQMWGARLAKLK